MIWLSFAVLALIGAIVGLLRTRTTRLWISAYFWRATGVSEVILAVLIDYVCTVMVVLFIMASALLICLAADAPTLATVILFIFGILLLLLTLPFWGGAKTISASLEEMKKAIDEIKTPEIQVKDISAAPGFETFREILSRIEQGLYRWFSPEVVIKLSAQILNLPVKATYGAIKRIVDTVNQLFGIVLVVVLWVMIIGFGLLYVPQDIEGNVPAGVVITVLIGLALIVAINKYKKWTTDAPYLLARFWIKTAVIFAIISMALLPLQVMFPTHNTAVQNAFRIWEEHSVKKQYGQRFDQNISQVIEPGVGFRGNGLFGYSAAVTLPLGEVLWRTNEKTEKGPDGIVTYAYYYRQSLISGLMPDAHRGVWYPESGTTALSLVMRSMVLPRGTHFRDDEKTVPDSALHSLPRRLTADVSPIIKHYDGEPHQLCRVVDRSDVFWCWVPEEEIRRISSYALAPTVVMTSAMAFPTGMLVPVDPPIPITLGTGDKYYRDLRTQPDLSCWIPLPNDLSNQEVVAKWKNPQTGRPYLRVRGPQWFNPSVTVHIWVDE